MSAVTMNAIALKQRLGLPCAVTSGDSQLMASLEGCEAAWLQATGRKLFFSGDDEKTLYLDGPGRNVILLPRPIVEVTEVYEDSAGYGGQGEDAFDVSTALTQGSEWWVDNLDVDEDNPAKLIRINAYWNSGRGSVKVVGKFGYTPGSGGDVPVDVLQALAGAVALEVKGSSKGGAIRAETIGKYRYELFTGQDGYGFAGSDRDTLSSIRATVLRYRELRAA